jgi:malic enzyme
MKDHKIVFIGAGSAAIGVADYLRFAMIEEGLSEKEARARFWVVDRDGVLDSDRRDLSDEQKTYAQDRNEFANWQRNPTQSLTAKLTSVVVGERPPERCDSVRRVGPLRYP